MYIVAQYGILYLSDIVDSGMFSTLAKYTSEVGNVASIWMTTRLQDYKFILKISTCVINAQSMQLLSRIFQDISRAIESRYLIVT